MNMNEKIDYIKNYILQNKKPSYTTLTRNKKGHQEIRVRCPYCGDSIKSQKSAHFYIELYPPFFWYCQRCDLSGVLNTQTLLDLNINDNDVHIIIKQLNRMHKLDNTYKKSWNNYKSNIKINKNLRKDDDFKYEYFNKRLGLNLSREYINEQYKVVTNFMEFVQLNRIPINDHNRDIIQNLDHDYIGFLSVDRSHVISRDVTNKHEKRYYNLKVNDDPFAKKIYTIKSTVDLLSPKLTLIMTEGIFDIIGVHQHLYNGMQPNNSTVFAAATGKSFSKVIEHFMNLGFLDIDIKIYADNDVKESFFRKIKKNNIYMRDKQITIYYNKKEKDFGVSKDKIDLIEIRI